MYILSKQDERHLPPLSENAKILYRELVEYAPLSAEDLKKINHSDWQNNDDFVDAINELKKWHLIKEVKEK